MAIEDGGFVHPFLGSDGTSVSNGITLRDWIATYAPSPDAGSIASVLGWSVRLDRWAVSDAGEDSMPHFDELWSRLPHTQKMEVLAKMRYAFADAMLSARKAGA